jgi:predicted DNA-binding protein YlxM (UPF0122 family)
MYDTIRRTVKNKTRMDNQIKFYRTVAIRSSIYGCETCGMASGNKTGDFMLRYAS